jgi:hypothetical protein
MALMLTKKVRVKISTTTFALFKVTVQGNVGGEGGAG